LILNFILQVYKIQRPIFTLIETNIKEICTVNLEIH